MNVLKLDNLNLWRCLTNEDIKALDDFLLDINCLDKLEKWTNSYNIFEVLKITNNEIRHTNFLAWLFDPNETHNMGDFFIKKIVSRVTKINCEQDNSHDFYSYQVYREVNHMDIVLLL